MIGTCGHVGARPQDAADFEAADDRQIQVEDDEIGRALGDRLQRGVAGADDLRVGVAAALQGVLDQAGDILLVFDNEDVMSGHEAMRLAYWPQVSGRCPGC